MKVHARRPSNLENFKIFAKEEWAGISDIRDLLKTTTGHRLFDFKHQGANNFDQSIFCGIISFLSAKKDNVCIQTKIVDAYQLYLDFNGFPMLI